MPIQYTSVTYPATSNWANQIGTPFNDVIVSQNERWIAVLGRTDLALLQVNQNSPGTLLNPVFGVKSDPGSGAYTALAFHPTDPTRLFYARNNAIREAELTNGVWTFVRSYSSSWSPTHMAMSPNGRWMAITQSPNSAYRIIEVFADSLTSRVSRSNAGSCRVAFSPDSRWLAVASTLNNIVRMERNDGGSSWGITNVSGGAGNSGIAWRPDSNQFVTTSGSINNGAGVFVHDLSGNSWTTRQLSTFAAVATYHSGKHLIVQRLDTNSRDHYTVSQGGNGPELELDAGVGYSGAASRRLESADGGGGRFVASVLPNAPWFYIVRGPQNGINVEGVLTSKKPRADGQVRVPPVIRTGALRAKAAQVAGDINVAEPLWADLKGIMGTTSGSSVMVKVGIWGELRSRRPTIAGVTTAAVGEPLVQVEFNINPAVVMLGASHYYLDGYATLKRGVLADITAPKASVEGFFTQGRVIYRQNLSAKLPVVRGALETPHAGAGVFTAPTARLDGHLDNYWVGGHFVSRLPTVNGSLSLQEYDISGQMIAPAPKAAGNISRRYKINGNARAPKARFYGFSGDLQTTGELRARMPSFDGLMLLPFEVEGHVVSKAAIADFNLTYSVQINADLQPRKPIVDGSVDVVFRKLEGALLAPLPGIESEISVPYLVEAELHAPKPVVAGNLFGAEPVEVTLIAPAARFEGELVGTEPLWADLVAPKGQFYAYMGPDDSAFANMVAPAAKMTGEMGNQVYAWIDLAAPQAKTDSEIKVEGREVHGDLQGLAPLLDGFVNVPIEVHADFVNPLRARAEGSIDVPFGLFAEMVAPKAQFVGHTLRVIRVDAAPRAPKARLDGFFHPTLKFSGDLRAPRPQIESEINADFVVRGEFAARAPTVAGELDCYYAVRGALQGRRPVSDANLLLRNYVEGDFVAPAPVGDFELRFHYYVNLDAAAPSPILEGAFKQFATVQGDLTAPSAIFEGEVRPGVSVAGALRGPMPILAGQYHRRYLVDIAGRAPSALLDGELFLRYKSEGDLVAPAAFVDGQLRARYLVDAELGAPPASAEGLLDLRYKVEGDHFAPAARLDGVIHARYLVEKDSYGPAAYVVGGLGAHYLVTTDAVAPSAQGGGLLHLRYILDGMLEAPRVQAAGELQTLMMRRQLRIIMPFERAT